MFGIASDNETRREIYLIEKHLETHSTHKTNMITDITPNKMTTNLFWVKMMLPVDIDNQISIDEGLSQRNQTVRRHHKPNTVQVKCWK